MADRIKEQLAGAWVVTRRENLCPYLKELGIPCSEDKVVPPGPGQSTQNIKVDGDIITMDNKCSRRHCVYTFKLDEEFEIDAGCGIPSQAVAKWENNGLMVRSVRKDGTKSQEIERRRQGDIMIMTMTTNKVTCKVELSRRT